MQPLRARKLLPQQKQLVWPMPQSRLQPTPHLLLLCSPAATRPRTWALTLLPAAWQAMLLALLGLLQAAAMAPHLSLWCSRQRRRRESEGLCSRRLQTVQCLGPLPQPKCLAQPAMATGMEIEMEGRQQQQQHHQQMAWQACLWAQPRAAAAAAACTSFWCRWAFGACCDRLLHPLLALGASDVLDGSLTQLLLFSLSPHHLLP